MMNKKILLIFLAFFLVVAFGSLISAFCAEKTLSGAWCQDVPENEVDKSSGLSWAQSSCQYTEFCKIGTCISGDSGTCAQNTPKALCESQGNSWSEKNKDNIQECKPGCCILGQEVAFVNQATCKSLATDYGVDINFRSDINAQSACLTLDTTPTEGACVISASSTATPASSGFFSNIFGGNSQTSSTSSTAADCKRTTQSGCSALGGNFNKGLLCAAPGLSDCAKDSTKTKIYRDKIYFADTCGNLANIYDESRFNDIDYWTNIQDSTCNVEDSKASSICGECSYRRGTIGAEYKSGDKAMPLTKPKYGNNVCRELSCYYDNNKNDKIETNEKYKHGESWCAQTPGTYPEVPFLMDDETKKEIAEGYDKYNLPGSRYVRLSCYNGEIAPEKCKDARNAVCMEAENPITNKREASCFINEGGDCSGALTKNSCEGNNFCKWVQGYGPGGAFLGYGLEDGLKKAGIEIDNYKTNKEKYDNLQGTCMPLFALAQEFWTPSGEEYCSGLSMTEKALFETGVLKQREEFAEDDLKQAANKCIDNCWAIPGYGTTDGKTDIDLEKLKDFQLETGELDANVQDVYLSKREGYYCKNKPDEPDIIDNWKTGAEKGSETACKNNEGKDLERRRIKQFYTHKQWLETISERTRSVGDCGYKPHAYSSITNWEGDANSEKITVSFQKLKQSGDEKKTVGAKETLYTGSEINSKTPLNSGYRNIKEIFYKNN